MPILNVGVTVRGSDAAMRAAIERLTRETPRHVDVGIFAKKNGALQVKIAAAHEFGAKIKHPGGTAYGYATADDERNHRVKFLAKGTGYKVLGITGPHRIVIPPRPYIRPTVNRNRDAYSGYVTRLARAIVDGDADKHTVLGLLGSRVQGDIRNTIRRLRTPPLRPATIARKKSDKPLVDTGRLIRSVNYQVD